MAISNKRATRVFLIAAMVSFVAMAVTMKPAAVQKVHAEAHPIQP
jgi:hypothetical protein